MVQKYLGLKHEYGVVDCIELIRLFYKNELGIEFTLPSYPHSRAWLKHFSTEHVDRWASTCALKVKLTDAENYDVIAFKSLNSNLVIHFGLFLKPTKIIFCQISCGR